MEHHIERFGAAAASYESAGELQEYVAARLAENIYRPYIKPGLTVLEIGCGTGFLTRHLPCIFGDAAQLIITDAAPEMVAGCKAAFGRAASGMTFERMDGQNITLPPRSVDHIVTSMTAQWFDDPVKSLTDMRPLLKPGGLLTYATVGCDNFTEWREHLERRGLDFGMRDLPEQYPTQWAREEFIPREYGSGKAFLDMLKATGAGTPKLGYQKPPPREFAKAVADFDGTVTWHIVYGRLPALNV